LKFACNGDVMHHVNKGLVGFKLDNVINAYVKNVHVQRALNFGRLPNTVCGRYVVSHENQNTKGLGLTRYSANNIRGFSLAGSKGITLV
jgi:hypothetical protein